MENITIVPPNAADSIFFFKYKFDYVKFSFTDTQI